MKEKAYKNAQLKRQLALYKAQGKKNWYGNSALIEKSILKILDTLLSHIFLKLPLNHITYGV